MDITISTDTRYLLPAKVLLCSIWANNKEEDITVHILTDDESFSDVNNMLESIPHIKDCCFVYRIDRSLYSDLPFGRPGQPSHVSVASYYRLFLASVLPNSVSKVLYLDCDIIVRSSLSELWNTDISSFAIGCVQDMSDEDVTRYNKLQYYPGEGYFNAGVLLINLDFWRKNNIEKELVAFACDYPERIVFHDQDVMNYVLRNRKYRLPFKYDVQDGYLYETRHFLYWPNAAELEEAVHSPVILHFSTGNKPWQEGCNHPYVKEYLKYVRAAGCDVRDFPGHKLHLNWYMRLRRVLVRFGILRPLLQFDPELSELSLNS